MSDFGSERNPIDALAEEFVARYRRGERPPLTEYIQSHPQWAEEVRELFPTLAMMEQLKPAPREVTMLSREGAPAGPTAAT